MRLHSLLVILGCSIATNVATASGYKRVVRSDPSLSIVVGNGHNIVPTGTEGGGLSGVQIMIDTTCSVGKIPLVSSVSPTGAQVYSIAVPTVEDIGFAPELSLTYNSQGGQGVAGWGWSIGGLSSITLSPKGLFYDGEVAPASAGNTAAVYRLDGAVLIPCVEDAFLQAGYQLQTESGRVMVKVHRNPGGQVTWFEARSPDGSLAEYGWGDGSRPSLVVYPLTRRVDRHGAVISYSYRTTLHSATGNDTFSISSVTYGGRAGVAGPDTARVVFQYADSLRTDVTETIDPII